MPPAPPPPEAPPPPPGPPGPPPDYSPPSPPPGPPSNHPPPGPPPDYSPDPTPSPSGLSYSYAGVYDIFESFSGVCTSGTPTVANTVLCTADSDCLPGFFCDDHCAFDSCGARGDFPQDAEASFCNVCGNCYTSNCSARCNGAVPAQYGLADIELESSVRVDSQLKLDNGTSLYDWDELSTWDGATPTSDGVVYLPPSCTQFCICVSIGPNEPCS